MLKLISLKIFFPPLKISNDFLFLVLHSSMIIEFKCCLFPLIRDTYWPACLYIYDVTFLLFVVSVLPFPFYILDQLDSAEYTPLLTPPYSVFTDLFL